MTSKFKVGDKVIFNEVNREIAKEFSYEPNKAYEIKNVFLLNGTIQIINENGMTNTFDKNRFLLAEPKQTKNQRITALENEVAELRPLKDTVSAMQERLEQLGVIVEKVRKPSTVVEEALTAASSVEDKPQSEGERLVKQCEQHFSPVEKSPNQQRAEMIEKAKKFIDENGGDDYHFDIDEKNGTVFAYKVITPSVGRYAVKHGFSKCHPNDVFNTDIGKVISFGRAEKLDVSEFEQVVQPTVPVVGAIVKYHSENRIAQVMPENSSGIDIDTQTYLSTSFSKPSDTTIINDTNAIYGGGE